MRRWQVALLGLVLILASVPSTRAQEQLSAKQILARVEAKYASCASYRDTGVSKTHFFYDDFERVNRETFSTAFERPGKLRFEHKKPKRRGGIRRYVIWSSGSEVKCYSDVNKKVETRSSLERALSRGNGVSGGAACRITRLLFPKYRMPGSDLRRLRDLERLDDGTFDGHACYRLRGQRLRKGPPTTIWIDEKTLLIRRIDSGKVFDDFRTEETVTYKPEINVKLDASELEFVEGNSQDAEDKK